MFSLPSGVLTGMLVLWYTDWPPGGVNKPDNTSSISQKQKQQASPQWSSGMVRPTGWARECRTVGYLWVMEWTSWLQVDGDSSGSLVNVNGKNEFLWPACTFCSLTFFTFLPPSLPASRSLTGLAHALQLIFKPQRCIVDVLPQGGKMETGWMFFGKLKLCLILCF